MFNCVNWCKYEVTCQHSTKYNLMNYKFLESQIKKIMYSCIKNRCYKKIKIYFVRIEIMSC